MARFKDDAVKAAFQPFLEQGETLKHWAYGVKQPHIGLIIVLIALAVLPGIIAVTLMTRNYVVGLTDRRVLVLRIGHSLKTIKDTIEYRLDTLPPAKTSTGPVFTHIKVNDEAKPFIAKFHRMGMADNRAHAQAIAGAFPASA